jgi:enamine deaminase RidA (YjgF/YER057c/UK114 family)
LLASIARAWFAPADAGLTGAEEESSVASNRRGFLRNPGFAIGLALMISACAGAMEPSLDKAASSGSDRAMIRKFNPSALAAPMSPYSHGVSIPAGMRIVQTAGQVGITKDGVVPPTVEEQLELIWTNTAAILAEDGLKLSDVVGIRGYIVSRDSLAAYRAAFRKYLGEVNPTSTLVVVKELVAPQFLVEIEVVAAGR